MMSLDNHYGADSGICVHRIGSEVTEPQGFTVDRPDGGGDYDFIHFLSPVTIQADNRRAKVRAGACLLYGPKSPQWYTAEAMPFTHDWFHFYGPSARRLVRLSGIPVNRVFYPARSSFITDGIREICIEIILERQQWQFAVSAMTQWLLVNVGRNAQPGNAPGHSDLRVGIRHKLEDIRVGVHARPEHRWSVSEMAQMACLSRSRFSLLYRELYGTSPMDDLIRLRLTRACRLLESSSLSAKTIARQLGFQDPAYFNRLFNRRLGLAPGKYRETHPSAAFVRFPAPAGTVAG